MFNYNIVTVVNIRHHRVLLMRVPEQMREDQRKVTYVLLKITF